MDPVTVLDQLTSNIHEVAGDVSEDARGLVQQIVDCAATHKSCALEHVVKEEFSPLSRFEWSCPDCSNHHLMVYVIWSLSKDAKHVEGRTTFSQYGSDQDSKCARAWVAKWTRKIFLLNSCKQEKGDTSQPL